MSKKLLGALVVALLSSAAFVVGQASAGQDPESEAIAALPEGEGRETVALYCGQCHAIGMVTSQKHTRAEWEDVLTRMADQGFYASEAETAVIVSYLSEHFNREPAQPAESAGS